MAVRLFIGNLPYGASEADLRAHFAAVAEPSHVVMPVDRETGRPRGFAFVEFADRAVAEDVIRKFDAQPFQGRSLAVSEARAREDRPPGAPRPGGFGSPRPAAASADHALAAPAADSAGHVQAASVRVRVAPAGLPDPVAAIAAPTSVRRLRPNGSAARREISRNTSRAVQSRSGPAAGSTPSTISRTTRRSILTTSPRSRQTTSRSTRSRRRRDDARRRVDDDQDE